ncbi:MAG: hypothetical protein GY866_23675, partial [Proteobacteria bacterium]|nr:hypothetical protein [Pseudomonadota bacterium]
LEIGSDPWKAGTFKTTFAEGEVFTSLVSSRLFLDHLIVATGLGLETPWQNRSGFGAKFLSADTLLEFPMRLEGLLTFGSDRKLQTRAQLEYQQTYDITGHTSIEHRNEKLSLGTSFIYRLTEVKKAEILLKGGLEFQEHLGKDQTGRKSRLASAELGIQVDRW